MVVVKSLSRLKNPPLKSARMKHVSGQNRGNLVYPSMYKQYVDLQGVPKKMVIWKGFEFLTLGGVFLGVKNNSKNFGNKKNIRLFSKILS